MKCRQEEITDEIKALQLTDTDVSAAQNIFWLHASKHPGGKEEFRKVLPEWCATIEALPELELLTDINVITCEITLDIVRQAKGLLVTQRG